MPREWVTVLQGKIHDNFPPKRVPYKCVLFSKLKVIDEFVHVPSECILRGIRIMKTLSVVS